MKQNYFRRTLSAVLLLLVSSMSWAEWKDFEVGGIFYTVLSYNESVSVTFHGIGIYSGDIVIPPTITYEGITYSVNGIGGIAFRGCTSLTSISIPSSMRFCFIGDAAFQGCTSLSSIYIPSGVTDIGYGVFGECPSLTLIKVSANNPFYDSREDCNAIIETSTNTLIAGCQNTTIPSGVTSIADYAFECCTSLTSISLPSSVASIGAEAFYYCTSLTSISLPDGLTSIGDNAFTGCTSLASISLPDGLTSIGDNAFTGCTSLASISLPDGLTSIGDNAFAGCTSLASITIPESVTSIEYGTFWDCRSLTTVICRAEEVPALGNDVFYGVSQSEATLYVPKSSLEAYKVADQWKGFGTILSLEEYETGIAAHASTQDNTSAPYYTPVGQRIAAPARGGIYIHKGRKVIQR